MSLANRINDELKAAMKSKDAQRLGTLRLVRAEILKKEKDGTHAEITDDVVLGLLNTMAKQRRDSIEQYNAGGRPDLAEVEAAELRIIAGFLPEAIGEDEIRAMIREVAASAGVATPQQMGKVMGPLMARLKAIGKSFDGKAVNGLVKEVLGG